MSGSFMMFVSPQGNRPTDSLPCRILFLLPCDQMDFQCRASGLFHFEGPGTEDQWLGQLSQTSFTLSRFNKVQQSMKVNIKIWQHGSWYNELLTKGS